MARRVVSLVRSAPRTLRATEPVLEANAYAVAEDIELTLVLRGPAVELAVSGAQAPARDVAGVALPASAAAQDLRGLVESGVGVHAAASDLAALGLGQDALVAGVGAIDEDGLAALLRDADAVLTW